MSFAQNTVKPWAFSGGSYIDAPVGSVPYAPSNFYSGATQKYWFDMTDSTKVLNSGGTSAGNGVNVQTVNDESGGALSLVQATALNQGTVVTGLGTSSVQALSVTGSPMTYGLTGTGNLACLNSATKLSFSVTFKLVGTASNTRFQRTFDNSFSFNRWNCFMSGAKPAMDMTTNTSAAVTSISPQTLVVGNIYTVTFEWDVANTTGNIYVNGVGGLGTTSFPAGTSIAATNSATAPDHLSTGSVQVFEEFLMVGALISNLSGQVAAIKSKVGF